MVFSPKPADDINRMGRATHARCLHCGTRLPLYRKLTDAEFCSAAHRKAFHEDQSRLAVERLMETQQICSRLRRMPAGI